MSAELAIDVRGLVKRFGDKTAVDGVDIQLPRGEVWGFLGPNGSGKTTTIRMVCGLLSPTEGEGECLGYDILKDAARIKAQTGYMTQRFSFWTDLTIRENLEFVARLYRLPDMKRKVDETLEGLGLTKRQGQLAGALSGGCDDARAKTVAAGRTDGGRGPAGAARLLGRDPPAVE